LQMEQASPPEWQSIHGSPSEGTPLMSPEVGQAMQTWTERRTLLTPGPRMFQQGASRDDSSSGSIPQEVIMDEVRRQVQMALQTRDEEMRLLRGENQDLREALRIMLETDEGGGGRRDQDEVPQEAPSGLRGHDKEPRGIPGGRGPGDEQSRENRSSALGSSGVPDAVPGDRSLPREVRLTEGQEHEAHSGGGGNPIGSGQNNGPAGTGGGPSADGVGQDPDLTESTDAMKLLVQGMRQLQQVYMQKKEAPEQEAIKGGVDLQPMPPVTGDSAVEFADWLYMTEQTVGGLTDLASTWFGATLKCAREAYDKYQIASPLERLTIKPNLPSELSEARWKRLERRVLTLLLNAMNATAKEDCVTHRVTNPAEALYRLHILYQPGGSSERAAILRQLEGSSAGEDPNEAVMQLRKWRRYLERAEECNIRAPDSSVLARAVDTISQKAIERFPEVKFRISLVKNELQIQSRPSQATVMKYVDHVMAELQHASPARKATQSNADQPKLRAVGNQQTGTGEQTPSSSSPSSKTGKNGGKAPCKFFLSEAGCRRGPACQFQHEFPTKDEKKSRCWHCGSRAHRQGECPVKEATKNGGKSQRAPTPKAAAMQPAPSLQSESQASGSQPQASVPASSSMSSSLDSQQDAASTSSDGTARDPEIKALLQEANAMLKKLGSLQALRTVEESAEMMTALRAILDPNENLALLDSGATHIFREGTELERATAEEVHVQLADGRIVALKQNRAGTLMPATPQEGAIRPTSIIPLGELVESLGCTLHWTRKRGLVVEHPEHGVLRTHVAGSCPMLGEAQALNIIQELEEQKLQRLHDNVQEGHLRALEHILNKEFGDYLNEYVLSGDRRVGLQALMDESSPFGVLTEAQRCMLIQDLDLSDKAGQTYVKSLPVKRAMRRKLLQNPWIVHLFSGRTAHNEFKVLEEAGNVILEVDIGKSKAWDLKDWSPAYRALLWAAMKGKIKGIFGEPPRAADGQLAMKQLFLWTVARQASVMSEANIPFFVLEGNIDGGFWTSTVWETFQAKNRMFVLESDDGCRCATTLSIDPPSEWKVRSDGHTTWTVKFKNALVKGMLFWKKGACVRRALGESSEYRDYKYMLTGAYVGPILEGSRQPPEDVIDNDEGAGVGALEEPQPFQPPLSPAEVPEEEPRGEQDGGEADDEYEALLDEQEVEEEPVSQEDKDKMAEINEKYKEVVKEVGDNIRYHVIRFAVPMRSRRTAEVNACVRKMLLQVEAEGLPVFRCHSDRARELCNGNLRAWFVERGILPTTGEPQSPQQNGRAEATVKMVKSHAKTLLRSSRLPPSGWPLAMAYAVYKQREEALGRKGPIPFGTPVHVRTKVYGTGGKYDLDPRWRQGLYVGPSPDVRGGHLVRFEDGSYVTSMHLRASLVPADDLVEIPPHEMDLPMPERRVRGKTSLSLLLASLSRPLSASEVEAEAFARKMFREKKWTVEVLLELSKLLGTTKLEAHGSRAVQQENQLSWLTGVFVHGGVAGIRNTTKRMKWTTKYLVKATKEITGQREFTALGLIRNTSFGCHRDVHNEADSRNVLLPLLVPENGGGLWIEDEDVPEEGAVFRTPPGAKSPKRGKVQELERGKPIVFSGRKWHEVQEWEGDRVVLIAFTPRATKLHEEDRRRIKELGFTLPKRRELRKVNANQFQYASGDLLKNADQFQYASGDLLKNADQFQYASGDIPKNADQSQSCEMWLGPFLDKEVDEKLGEALERIGDEQELLLDDLEERQGRLRELLEQEEVLAEECQRAGKQISEEIQHVQQMIYEMMESVGRNEAKDTANTLAKCLQARRLCMMQTTNEQDYEALVANLQEDLKVVHTVPLEQVKPVIHRWWQAIQKELDTLFAGTLQKIPLSRARELERSEGLRIVPSKGVFTLKPPGSGTKNERVRRKFRLVLCGNFVARGEDDAELYAGGASAETLRTSLAFAALRRWLAASTDIVSAFLLALWPDDMPKYAILPPKYLVNPEEEPQAWLVLRPLYGLRESPSIWARCRALRMSMASIPCGKRTLKLKPSKADPELWLIFANDNDLDLLGLIITYVDDLLYLSEEEIIRAIHVWLEEEWPTSGLQFANQGEGVRYLGMEIKQDENCVFHLAQSAYIRDLLRSHSMDDAVESKLPCPKEWLADEELDEQENFSELELKMAQKIVGEQLWLCMRTRPDLLFPVNYMASRVSKQPNKVKQIGGRIMSYLKATEKMELVIGRHEPSTSTSSTAAAEAADTTSKRACASIPCLTAFSDASFAPYGSRSFGACVVTVNGAPVAWKASKQAFIVLSVMEAELYEATQATVLLESIGCLLDELSGTRLRRILRVDNTSALAMLAGGQGSWRTRHLKVRSAHVRQQVELGLLEVEHVDGCRQLADLATKMHSKARLWDLLQQWCFVNLPAEAVQLVGLRKLAVVCVVLAMLIIPAGASSPSSGRDDSTAEPMEATTTGRSIKVTGADELFLLTIVVCVATVGFWEGLKHGAKWFWGLCRESPKNRRLRKLREAARAAAEVELDRTLETDDSLRQSSSPREVRARVLETASRTPIPPPPVVEPAYPPVPPIPEVPRGATSSSSPWELRAPEVSYVQYPTNQFWKTGSASSKIHTSPHCHGLNGVQPRRAEYCQFCNGARPLYRRSIDALALG
ncbi:RE1, partial [Symbiodinium natans]